MKRLAFLLVFISVSLVWGAEKIAFTTKVSGQVNLVNLQEQTVPLKRGTVVNSGEQIVTLTDGLAVIMFIDDKSLLRIQKNTTLTVGGERSATAISKQVDMQFGKLRAQVTEQRQEGAFVISTPTSVASVKGTDFWATSDPVLGDIFLGIDGLIEVENLISGGVIEVGGGQMGTSEPDGTTAVATYVLIVSELLSVSENVLTMEPAEIGEGDARMQFNGQVALTSQTTYAGPDPEVGSTATISGIANDDGSVTAVQVAIEEIEEELEEIEDKGPDEGEGEGEGAEAEEAELRIRFVNQDGTTKELVIIYK
ncbi:MAG: FecR domain-containing protein [Fidelibacterota bacterium]|nr:MAG: FecR domain-containing protein [Candidatus Neomarinimicrobiota bacterium]